MHHRFAFLRQSQMFFLGKEYLATFSCSSQAQLRIARKTHNLEYIGCKRQAKQRLQYWNFAWRLHRKEPHNWATEFFALCDEEPALASGSFWAFSVRKQRRQNTPKAPPLPSSTSSQIPFPALDRRSGTDGQSGLETQEFPAERTPRELDTKREFGILSCGTPTTGSTLVTAHNREL